MKRLNVIRLLALLLVSGACSDPLGVPRDPDASIQTDQLEYALSQRGLFIEGAIDFTYGNTSGAPIYIQNCGGAYGIALEQLRDSEWRTVWGNTIPACITEAIIIAPGQSLTGRLAISAGIPICACGGFATDQIEGIYRMVITAAFDDVDADGFATGELLPTDQRMSNRFVLTL